MWREFQALAPSTAGPEPAISSWHFCDNPHDADECARLTLAGRKRATAPSRWSFEHAGEPLPRVGDLHVVTNWAGEAQCIIRITAVEIVPFDGVTADHARAEGEGDGTLAWWREAHWAYYQRELAGSGHPPRPDMPIVFEWFECVHPVATPGSGTAEQKED
ncbi:ASCH domain-containing protein [Lysobacter sp. A3-1-A15]|uniref:ASCH domain-containing protein n=1 Tax=Novilysobacter viscosus TaxID=3098602 RepID=UPI002ED961B9